MCNVPDTCIDDDVQAALLPVHLLLVGPHQELLGPQLSGGSGRIF